MTDNERIEQQLIVIETLLRQVLAKVDPLTPGKAKIEAAYYDTSIYGDFSWLLRICPGIPTSTLRKKSSAGIIPGYRKIGNRVLYNKKEVVEWIERSQKP